MFTLDLLQKPMLKRILDIVVAAVGITIFLIPSIFIYIAIRTSSKGPVIFWSLRCGKDEVPFLMPKFRTMVVGTPLTSTASLKNPGFHITRIGELLRKTSLDEIPQLYSVIVGHMSIVGPRPALLDQTNVIYQRRRLGVHVLKPGITGLAQVNGRDEISDSEKVKYDEEYLQNLSLAIDVKIIISTVFNVFQRKGVSH